MSHIQEYDRSPPSYEEVMCTYEYTDSMRLPTYQSRSLGRYHPYIRYTPTLQLTSTRYMNTIYDDEYVELNVPPPLPPQNAPVTPVAPPTTTDSLVFPVDHNLALNPEHGNEYQQENDQEHIQRIHRLGGLIVEFFAGVQRAMESQKATDHEVVETGETFPVVNALAPEA